MDKNRPAPGTVPFDTAQIRGFLDERFTNGGPLFDDWLRKHVSEEVAMELHCQAQGLWDGGFVEIANMLLERAESLRRR